MNDFRTEFIIKNFIWFLVFVCVCVFCVAQILLPQMRNYKIQAIETRKSQIALNQVQKDYKAIQAQLQSLSVQNYKSLSSLYTHSDETKIQSLLQERFSQVIVNILGTSVENEILSTQYQIVGYAQNTQVIEDFILWVNTMPYFVRVELPLKMEFDEKSKQIYFVMILSVKQSQYVEHQIITDNNLKFLYFKP